jgi:hypothetical protein
MKALRIVVTIVALAILLYSLLVVFLPDWMIRGIHIPWRRHK